MLTPWILVPLAIVLLACIATELRDGLIRDALTLPSLLYFLIVQFVMGLQQGMLALGAAVGIVAIAVVGGVVIPKRIRGIEMLGMGAIKLLGSVAAAIGPWRTVIMGIAFLAAVPIALLVERRRADSANAVPSSPIIAVCAAIALAIAGLSR